MIREELDALVARAQDGDLRAFEALAVAFSPQVRRFARAFAASEADADDLALSQERALWKVALGAAGGAEWLRYRADSYRDTHAAVGVLDRRRREDVRGFGGLWAAVRPWGRLELTLRWDALVNRSNVARTQGRCRLVEASRHALDYDGKNYTKQVVVLDATWRW